MNQDILNIIAAQFPLLYEKELQEEIAVEGILKEVAEGELIMDIGNYIKMMPLLVEGSIRIIREDEEGNELLMYYLAAGETCAMSLTCCLQDQQSDIRAIAEEDCTLIIIPVRFMDQWMNKYKCWKEFVMNTYQIRFKELLLTIDSIAFMNMDERLLKYLKDKTESTGSTNINTTHQDIAYELNSSREVISRLLKKLESKGVVKLSRNKVEVLSLM